jgi:pyrrolidone-carboxylate peptidase
VASFGRPDRQGYYPQNEPIVAEHPLDYKLSNPLDLAQLREEMGDYFQISDDAGEYICNYAYFYALMHVGVKIRGCCFVHVPSFRDIDFESQVQQIQAIARKILALEAFQ